MSVVSLSLGICQLSVKWLLILIKGLKWLETLQVDAFKDNRGQPLHNGHVEDRLLHIVVEKWSLWEGRGVIWHLFFGNAI